MDIRQYAMSPTGVLHLRDAADNLMYADDARKKPMRIHLYGPGSREYQNAEKRNSNRMMEGFRRKGRAPDPLELRIDLMTAVTQRFENIEYDGLKDEALYRAVYNDPELRFVRDQVDVYLSETANFTKAQPES